MSFRPSPALYQAMFDCVVATRRMRALQDSYFRAAKNNSRDKQSRLHAAKEAEREVDTLSLAAVRQDQVEREAGDPETGEIK